MPWPPPVRARASLSYALLAVSLGVVMSCTTVASSADPQPSAEAFAVAVPTAVALTLPSPTPSPPPTASPLPSPTLVPSAVLASTEPSIQPLAPAAEVTGPTLDQKTTAKLQRIIDNWTGNKGVAGLQVAVRLPTGETWLGDAGQAEFSPDRPIDDETQFAIASVTKTFVAALILQLAEEGKVDLDATFGTYFRDAPRKDTVTLRQLLSHTSGIYNFWANPRYGEITKAWWETPNAGGLQSRSHEWTYDEMMALVKNGEFKPGKDYQYSNTNYVILGKVAEAVEGKSLAKQLRQRFFEPLGLEGTVYQPDQKPDTDAAHGHWSWGAGYTDHTKESRYVPFIAAVTVADAAGAMASTAADLATWASALYGGEVLPAELTEQMTRFLKPGYYGLGADVAYFAGNRGHGHRGGIRGYESSMWYFPETGVSIVMLSNQGNWGSDEVMGKLVKAVLGSN